MTSKPRPVQIFLFRHGETDWNRERRFQGHTDIPLNDEGRAQARTLALELKKLDLDVLLTSDLLRAKETADLVNAELNLPLFIEPRLRECRLGDPEGQLRDSIIENYGAAAWDRWLSVDAADHHYGFPNGKTKHEHLQRLLAGIETFCRTHPQFKRVGISTHGGSVRRLAHHAEGAPNEPIPLPNCALYELQYSPAQNIWTYGGSFAKDILVANAADANVWAKS